MGEGAFGSDGKNRGRRRLLMTKEEFLQFGQYIIVCIYLRTAKKKWANCRLEQQVIACPRKVKARGALE